MIVLMIFYNKLKITDLVLEVVNNILNPDFIKAIIIFVNQKIISRVLRQLINNTI